MSISLDLSVLSVFLSRSICLSVSLSFAFFLSLIKYMYATVVLNDIDVAFLLLSVRSTLYVVFKVICIDSGDYFVVIQSKISIKNPDSDDWVDYDNDFSENSHATAWDGITNKILIRMYPALFPYPLLPLPTLNQLRGNKTDHQFAISRVLRVHLILFLRSLFASNFSSLWQQNQDKILT